MSIIIQGISKSYGKNEILKDISFTASPGECICFTGRNGCGKTTLLSILALVDKPDSGTISYIGTELKLGYLPQINPLLDMVSVKDNLKLWCNSKASYDYAIDRFELSSMLRKSVKQLSGGMKRRLALACSMANKPDILIMDEPTAALDIEYKQLIHSEMINFTNSNGIILMVSHEKEEIELSDICYYMENGCISIKS